MTDSTTPTDTGSGPRRRFERSRHERWIAGVSGGLGRYFNIDPVIVRLAFIALTFAGGVGIAAYGVAWLIVPAEGARRSLLQVCLSRGDRWAVIGGAVLLGLGAIALLDSLDLWFEGGGFVWALLLLGGGAWLLLRGTEVGRSLGLDIGPRPATTPSLPGGASASPGGDEAPTAPLADGASAPPGGDEAPTAPLAARGPRRRRRRTATRIALGAVMTVCGAGALLVGAGVLDVGWDTYVGATVVVAGVALVASAWFGGSPTLIWIGLTLAATFGSVVAADIDLEGGIGDRVYRPASSSDIKPEYQLGVGRLWIDLRDTELPAGTTRVRAKLGVGELTVVVPDGVRVESQGEVGVGELRLLGGHKDGVDIDQRVIAAAGPSRPGAAARPGAPAPVPVVVIEGDLGMGELRVFQGDDSPTPDDERGPRRDR